MRSGTALVLASVLAAGCGERGTGTGTGPDGGDATVMVSRAGLAASAANVVWINVYGATPSNAAFNRWYSGVPVSGKLTIALRALPLGTYGIHALAFADGMADPTVDPAPPADFENVLPDPTFTIVRGNNPPLVMLWLQQTQANPPGSVSNAAPAINSVVASALNVDSGDALNPPVPVTLSATVSDADGDPLTWTWSASPAVGTFGAGTGALPGTDTPPTRGKFTVTWTPPLGYFGPVTLTLSVTDTGAAVLPMTAAVSLAVQASPGARARGNKDVPLAINGWPDVFGFAGSPAQLLTRGTSQLTLDAEDPDMDDVTVTMSSACGTIGSVTHTPGTTLYSATFTAGATPGPCAVTATASDPNGGATTSTIFLNVVSSVPTAYAPDFVAAMFIPPAPVDDENVTFSVKVVDPVTGLNLDTGHLDWLAYASDQPGSFAAKWYDAAQDLVHVTYMPAVCGAGAGTFPVTVTATATGASPDPANPNASTYTFSFNMTCTF